MLREKIGGRCLKLLEKAHHIRCSADELRNVLQKYVKDKFENKSAVLVIDETYQIRLKFVDTFEHENTMNEFKKKRKSESSSAKQKSDIP